MQRLSERLFSLYLIFAVNFLFFKLCDLLFLLNLSLVLFLKENSIFFQFRMLPVQYRY